MKAQDDCPQPAPAPQPQRHPDDDRFDSLARNVARGFSRRQALAGLGAAVIGALSLGRTPVAADEVIVVEDVDPYDNPVDLNKPCGGTYCTVNEYCCNESCGICAPIGGACTQEFCGEVCGPTTCGYGEYCCNESCGICAPIGGGCIQQFCGEVCGPTYCGSGEYCCCGVCVPNDYGCAAVVCEACGDTVCRPGEKCCHSYYSGTNTCIPADSYCPL